MVDILFLSKLQHKPNALYDKRATQQTDTRTNNQKLK